MPNLDGVEATRRIVGSGNPVRVIVLTTYDVDEHVHETALRAGASGFLLKDVQPTQLVDAIRVVAAGDALLAPSVTRRLLDRFARTLPDAMPPPDSLSSLTEREVEVLRLLATGLVERRSPSPSVCSSPRRPSRLYVSSVLHKLEVRDRVQAVVLVDRYGTGSPRARATDHTVVLMLRPDAVPPSVARLPI